MLKFRRKKLIYKRQSRSADFIIVGTQKAGTTALYHYLKEHPEIGMASKKELHFFNNEITYSKPYLLYPRYEKFFDFNSGKKVYGEATPSYIYLESCPGRIWEYNPHIKLIFVLRNPVQRAFSHWNMEVDRGNETHSFSESIKLERERNQMVPFLNDKYSYVTKGFYAEQIRRYRRFFTDQQMLFIKYETFKKHQEETLDRIFNFLGVDPELYTFSPRIVHKRPAHGIMSTSDQEHLIDTFKYDIKDVERLLGWDCSDWLSIS
ncbi:MAG TPA: sulfotransferase domain-containing protein [Membranihabitans sp.]|nr:sulfotransferase domain-containing protein [Membranihabitans sp.]